MCFLSVVKPGVLFLEAAQVLAHHVILPDLLVDDQECRIDGQRCREQDHGQFHVHAGRLLPVNNRIPVPAR
jgi:hypothetical protein